MYMTSLLAQLLVFFFLEMRVSRITETQCSVNAELSRSLLVCVPILSCAGSDKPFDIHIFLIKNIYRGSYTSGHFGRNLYKPLARFVNFIGNYRECKILFIIWPFKMEIYHLQNVSRRKHIVDTVLVKDVTWVAKMLLHVWSCNFYDMVCTESVTSCDKTYSRITSFLQVVFNMGTTMYYKILL